MIHIYLLLKTVYQLVTLIEIILPGTFFSFNFRLDHL